MQRKRFEHQFAGKKSNSPPITTFLENYMKDILRFLEECLTINSQLECVKLFGFLPSVDAQW